MDDAIQKGTFVYSFIGCVCRTDSMHQLLYFMNKFPNYIAFTLGHYLFSFIFIQFGNKCSGWLVGLA